MKHASSLESGLSPRSSRRRSRLAGLFVAGAFAATLALSPSAVAQPKPPAGAGAAGASAAGANLVEAKKHYGEGEKKYKAGDFSGALAEFQSADAIKSTPQSQRFIGLCHDNLGHYVDAVPAYERFLAAVPDKMQKEGDEIKKRVEQIKGMPARVHIETVPAGASILADGKPMGMTPAEVELAPGKHILHLELAGYQPVDRDVDLAYAAKQDLRSELQAKPVEATPVATTTTTTEPPKNVEPAKPEPAREARSKLPAFITGGLAIVAVGLGTGFGIAALMKQSDFNKNPTADTADTGENFALVADMAFGVAITLGVTSAVLFLTKDDDAAPKSASGQPTRTAKKKPIVIIPTPFITPNGGGAGALLRF